MPFRQRIGIRIDILAYGMKDETTALKVEAAAIDLIRLKNLSNTRRGHEAGHYGRITTTDLIGKLFPNAQLNTQSFTDNCILIRINKLYYSGIPPIELYEKTRGVWRASLSNCEKTKYALAVCQGIVREVYLVAGWFKGGSTMYSTRESYPNKKTWTERMEFVGRIADEDIRNKYIHQDVSQLWSNGAQYPITYFGPSFNKKNVTPNVPVFL